MVANAFAGRLKEISQSQAGQFALGNLRGEALTTAINGALSSATPATSLQAILGEEGATAPSTAAVPTAGEVRIQHEENWQRNLPPAAALTDTAQREAYIVRLRTDAAARDALAQGLVSEVFGGRSDVNAAHERAIHEDVLHDLRARVAAPGAVEADKAAFNSIIDQIQQAYIQRTQEAAQQAESAGASPADVGAARHAAFVQVAPIIAEYESMKV
jgi:hypothetical protein